MVVICLPSAALTGSEQERTGAPSRCTVQAPHCAMPQPYLVPVKPTFSRIAHSSGVSGSILMSCVCPLMVSLAMRSSLVAPVSWLIASSSAKPRMIAGFAPRQ